MDEELIRNNEMIAAYLDGVVREGWKVQGKVQNIWEGNVAAVYREAFMKRPGRVILTDQLEFHSSWDWLIPVIQKIRNDHKVDIHFNADSTSCHIVCIRGIYAIVVSGSVSEPILPLYGAVCKFIKWYNEQRTEREASQPAGPQ
jgi:hypothetical protein